jgi:uncharacterized protein involved in exopolysaccharide biosynthesis
VVVDRAVVPERKAWPPRRLLFLLALAFSLILALFWVGASLLWSSLRQDPIQREHIATMRNSFRFRR